MCFSAWKSKVRQREAAFEAAQSEVVRLDHQGVCVADDQMYRAYQWRNSFGVPLDRKIYRIFQKQHYDNDRRAGVLTLPRASATVWADSLENPLAHVSAPDPVTGQTIDFGNLTRNYFALCWTHRAKPTKQDWASFSHGGQAVRVTATAGELLSRFMIKTDSAYMHRTWLIEVAYRSACSIKKMKTLEEVSQRMESTGSLLALSAAIVRSAYSSEDEVRLLFDNGVLPVRTDVDASSENLLRIPFDWNGFVESVECYP